MSKLKKNEYWAILDKNGDPWGGCWPEAVETNRKEAETWARKFNVEAAHHRPDPKAPYRVARVAIVEVTPDY